MYEEPDLSGFVVPSPPALTAGLHLKLRLG